MIEGGYTAAALTWKIRPMRLNDYEGAFQCWARIAGLKMSEANFRTGLAVLIEQQARLSFVAECRGEIVATAMCGSDEKSGYVNQIIVAPEFRGQGIEQALFEACQQGFFDAGLTECRFGYGRENATW